jgi:hypothetical protein
MKIEVGVADAVLGTVAFSPQGLKVDGPEKDVLAAMVARFRSVATSDKEAVERMLKRLQGYTWAEEVPAG